MSLTFTRAAAVAYRELERDPTQADVLAAVDAILDQLEADPGHRSVRRSRFVAPIWGRQLWAVAARGRHDDWLILWDTAADGRPKVFYLGATSLSLLRRR